MNDRAQRRIAWRWWAQELVAVALVACGLSLGTGYSSPDNVQGAVYAWAHANPDKDVPVLIQTDGDQASLAHSVRSSGGTVNRQFSIVSAIEARVPPSSLARLATEDSVAWISLDAPVVSAGGAVDTSNMVTTYPITVNANDPWSKGFTGSGVGVAIVDTGISPSGHEDFKGADGYSRVRAEVEVAPNTSNVTDGYGHGTHVAGIVAGDGDLLDGKYIGVAPRADLLSIKVMDDEGDTTIADVIAGLEWVYNNRSTYDIRVVNLSLTSSVAQSYKVDPLDAAVEALWFSNVFVVVAAGNLGTSADAVNYPPANDPFVMTVGAIDDLGTSSSGDDVLTSWSSRGVTQDGFKKPELVAPGRNITSVIDTNSILYKTYPEKIVDKDYFRLSGTSMAAPVVSGVAALVLERHPDWTPGQLKCTLTATSRSLSGSGARVPRAGSALNQSRPNCNSDAGLAPSTLLGPVAKVGAVAHVLAAQLPVVEANQIGLTPLDAVGPLGTNMSNVNWGAIKWDVIKWDLIKWDLIKWDLIKWDAIKWDAIKWDAVSPDGVDFNTIKWNTIKWSAIKWDAIKWSAITWSAIKWDIIKWGSIKWDYVADD